MIHLTRKDRQEPAEWLGRGKTDKSILANDADEWKESL